MPFDMRFYINRMHQFDSFLCVAVSHTSQYKLRSTSLLFHFFDTTVPHISTFHHIHHIF